MLTRSVKYTSILRTSNQIMHGPHCYLRSFFYPYAGIMLFEISSSVYGCINLFHFSNSCRFLDICLGYLISLVIYVL